MSIHESEPDNGDAATESPYHTVEAEPRSWTAWWWSLLLMITPAPPPRKSVPSEEAAAGEIGDDEAVEARAMEQLNEEMPDKSWQECLLSVRGYTTPLLSAYPVSS